MDQLPNGWGPAVLVLKLVWSARASSVWKHRLELSTGVVVGYCYHKAADLRVRQAAHSFALSHLYSVLLCIAVCNNCSQGITEAPF